MSALALAMQIPEVPSTRYVRALVPNTTKGMLFGTRVLEYWVLGPSWFYICSCFFFRGFAQDEGQWPVAKAFEPNQGTSFEYSAYR